MHPQIEKWLLVKNLDIEQSPYNLIIIFYSLLTIRHGSSMHEYVSTALLLWNWYTYTYYMAQSNTYYDMYSSVYTSTIVSYGNI